MANPGRVTPFDIAHVADISQPPAAAPGIPQLLAVAAVGKPPEVPEEVAAAVAVAAADTACTFDSAAALLLQPRPRVSHVSPGFAHQICCCCLRELI